MALESLNHILWNHGLKILSLVSNVRNSEINMEADFNPSVPQHSKQSLLYPYTEVSVCRSTFSPILFEQKRNFRRLQTWAARASVCLVWRCIHIFRVVLQKQTDRPLSCLHLHPSSSTAYYRKGLENPTTEGCTTKTVNKRRDLEQHNGLVKKMYLWIITTIYLENEWNVILRVF